MTTVENVLIYEALELNKKYKENRKKELSDSKRKLKLQKASEKQANTVTKSKIKKTERPKVVTIKKKKKYSDTVLDFDIRIHKQKDDILIVVWNYYKPKFKQRQYKSIGQLARLVFADYVLLKKSDDKWICSCVTCGKELHRSDPNMHPWHFRTAWTSLKYKFVLDNVRPQDYYCNVWLHWNYGKYTLFMIDTFGRERVDNILSDKSLFKVKDWDYIDMIKERWSEVELLMKVKKSL